VNILHVYGDKYLRLYSLILQGTPNLHAVESFRSWYMLRWWWCWWNSWPSMEPEGPLSCP